MIFAVLDVRIGHSYTKKKIPTKLESELKKFQVS